MTTDTPTVKLLEATPDPEHVICKAARNDYSTDFIGSQPFGETMETIDGDTTEEKMETLIGHLLSHGHFGPSNRYITSFWKGD